MPIKYAMGYKNNPNKAGKKSLHSSRSFNEHSIFLYLGLISCKDNMMLEMMVTILANNRGLEFLVNTETKDDDELQIAKTRTHSTQSFVFNFLTPFQSQIKTVLQINLHLFLCNTFQGKNFVFHQPILLNLHNVL